MPEISVIQITLITLAIIAGLAIGWSGRGKRCNQEKSAINVGWQEQLETQRDENKRLAGQNKGLMEQVSHFQASQKDASNRASELSAALKEAFARRDHLQREVKEVRSQLAAALAEKKNLESSVASLSAKDKSSSSAVKEKDDKIFQLSRELDSWHARLPPLIARFQARDADASALQEQLEAANHRISTLEAALDSDQTQFETIDSANLAEEYDASNDTLASTIGPASGEQFREALNGAASDYPRTHEPVTPDDSRREAESKASVTVADNLQDIKGVGPAIEKTLHQLGFFRFGQIAEMSEYDIDRVARHLKGFRSRIYREDWIGQARELRSRRAGGPV